MGAHESKLADIVVPAVEALGLTLWGLSYSGSGNRGLVRIYVDGEEGVSIDQCAEASRAVGLALDVADIMTGPYTLEVSSPGLERRFFDLDQAKDYVGRQVKAKLFAPMDGQKNFQGTLLKAEGGKLVLETETGPVSLAWESVAKARLVHEF